MKQQQQQRTQVNEEKTGEEQREVKSAPKVWLIIWNFSIQVLSTRIKTHRSLAGSARDSQIAIDVLIYGVDRGSSPGHRESGLLFAFLHFCEHAFALHCSSSKPAKTCLNPVLVPHSGSTRRVLTEYQHADCRNRILQHIYQIEWRIENQQ